MGGMGEWGNGSGHAQWESVLSLFWEFEFGSLSVEGPRKASVTRRLRVETLRCGA